MKEKIVIVSLGGSVLVPSSGINVEFLRNLRKTILRQKNKRFVIICGGGSISRVYQKAATDVSPGVGSGELDWIGVQATRLNAQLIYSIFSDVAFKEIVTNPTKAPSFTNHVLVAAGWKPGWSTDYVAVLLAKKYNVKTIVNITSKPFVYDRNPDEHKGAKPLKKISWGAFRIMVGEKWKPGLNVPFDPAASRLASETGMKIVVVGSNIANLEKLLDEKPFEGSTIEG